MAYVNVEDGVYTGVQIHASPELKDLLQYVPRHRAERIVLEVKGGAVIDEIYTTESLVSFSKSKGSARQFLADNGIEVVQTKAPQAQSANPAIASLQAQNAELKALVEKLLAKSSVPTADPAPAPVAEESKTGKSPLLPWAKLQKLDEQALRSLAYEWKDEISGDIARMNTMKLRSALNRLRIDKENANG